MFFLKYSFFFFFLRERGASFLVKVTNCMIFLRFIWLWKLVTQRRLMSCVIDTPFKVFWMSNVCYLYSVFLFTIVTYPAPFLINSRVGCTFPLSLYFGQLHVPL